MILNILFEMPTNTLLNLPQDDKRQCRLRVSIIEGYTPPSQDATIGYGDVEDYLVGIKALEGSCPLEGPNCNARNPKNTDTTTNNTSLPNSITEGGVESTFSVYPNPVKDELNILLEVRQAGPLDIEIFSLNGVKVYSMDQSHVSQGHQLITLGNLRLSSGYYILRVRVGSIVKTKQVIFK